MSSRKTSICQKNALTHLAQRQNSDLKNVPHQYIHRLPEEHERIKREKYKLDEPR